MVVCMRFLGSAILRRMIVFLFHLLLTAYQKLVRVVRFELT